MPPPPRSTTPSRRRAAARRWTTGIGALAEAESALIAARAAEADLSTPLDANDAEFSAASEGLARAQREVRELRHRA